jgi:hypothetical protein
VQIFSIRARVALAAAGETGDGPERARGSVAAPPGWPATGDPVAQAPGSSQAAIRQCFFASFSVRQFALKQVCPSNADQRIATLASVVTVSPWHVKMRFPTTASW